MNWLAYTLPELIPAQKLKVFLARTPQLRAELARPDQPNGDAGAGG